MNDNPHYEPLTHLRLREPFVDILQRICKIDPAITYINLRRERLQNLVISRCEAPGSGTRGTEIQQR